MIGGWLANPVTKYGIRGPGGLFERFPYLLPCLVSVIFNCIVFVVSIRFLDETNQEMRPAGATRTDVEVAETDQLLHRPHTDGDHQILGSAKGKPKSGQGAVIACVAATA